MAVFVLEKVPVSLRRELTRWALELKAGRIRRDGCGDGV